MGILVVLVAGLQVGRPRESAVVTLVAVLAVGLMALYMPKTLVFAGGALVFAGSYGFAGVPAPELGAALIILGALAANNDKWFMPGLLLLSAPLMMIWVITVALEDLSDPAVNKRLLSVLLWVIVMFVVAMSTNTETALARGLLLGLLVSLPAGLVMGSYYGNRSAGLFGDPNSFAMVVAVTTPLIVDKLDLRRWGRFCVWALSGLLVVLSDSRTGMLSLLVALVVYLVVPRMRVWALTVPVLAVAAASLIPDDVIRGGRWEERAGSDELRQRIDAASERQISESPWTGHGLSSGKVDLSVFGDPPQDLVFLLHNSYKSLITEIGFVGLGLYALVGLGAIAAGLRSPIARGALASICAAAVMATQLGEVLLAIPVALAFGFAWGSATQSREGLAGLQQSQGQRSAESALT